MVFYGVHRGFDEKRASLIIFAGLVAGLTSEVVTYTLVTIAIALGFFVCSLAVSRWRSSVFWRHVVLLLVAFTLGCAWRVVPMLQATDQLDRVSEYTDDRVDLLSLFVNRKNPVLGPIAIELLQIPEKPRISDFSYIGILPIALIFYGLARRDKRRKLLPWLGMLLVFLILSLGSTLAINGTEYAHIKLPKHFLNQLLPQVFAAFYYPNFFMTGAWLPLAVSACLGLAALLDRIPIAWRPKIVLACALIVAFEYYSPIPETVRPGLANALAEERLVFLDWFENEEQSNIALINLPLGKHNSWRYSWFQSLSGYPQVEGFLSRTPGNAYDYIKANFLLNAWYNRRSVHCEMTEKASYLAGLAQLEQDGFSHVVHHHDLLNTNAVSESFRDILPAYQDQFVSIYRLSDLRNGCPETISARHRFTSVYADALKNSPIPDERHETLVILPPTQQVSDHFMRYLGYFDPVDWNIIAVASMAPGQVNIRSSESDDLERQNAVWLLTDRLEFAPEANDANYAWFLQRFQNCQQIYADAAVVVDLYLKLDIPCTAVDGDSALDVRYQDGVRLHNASVEVKSDRLSVFFAWTNNTPRNYSYSIQVIDEDGQRAVQRDSVIERELLSTVEIETAQLAPGSYVVKLIVYDFDTGASQPGTVHATMDHFEREFELARVEL